MDKLAYQTKKIKCISCSCRHIIDISSNSTTDSVKLRFSLNQDWKDVLKCKKCGQSFMKSEPLSKPNGYTILEPLEYIYEEDIQK